MDLPSTLEKQLTPLKTLERKVREFANLCLPDLYLENPEGRLEFRVHRKSDDDVGKAVLVDREGDAPHVFTDWSRSQLLSHMGVREKWFLAVSVDREASELNSRLHTMRDHVLRTMRVDDKLRAVRGFVSSSYADIPDTMIMEALTGVLPDGYAVSGTSGKTDKAMYVYALQGKPVGIGHEKAYPGVVIKNSEVGYTSLWMVPMLFLPHASTPVVFEQEKVLRKIHRGNVEDLHGAFAEALDKVAGLWGPLEERLRRLSRVMYKDEDEALDAMEKLLMSAKGSRGLWQDCRNSYKAKHHSLHTGMAILEAILANVPIGVKHDVAYVTSAIAGAVLYNLLH